MQRSTGTGLRRGAGLRPVRESGERLRVVLDTNVLISALMESHKPGRLLRRALTGRFTLVLSKPILDELIDVLRREYFREFVRDDQAERFVAAISRVAEHTMVTSRLKAVLEDPDDAIINTALDGRASYIVSGDEHLLHLKEFKEIRIVTIDEMLRILG